MRCGSTTGLVLLCSKNNAIKRMDMATLAAYACLDVRQKGTAKHERRREEERTTEPKYLYLLLLVLLWGNFMSREDIAGGGDRARYKGVTCCTVGGQVQAADGTDGRPDRSSAAIVAFILRRRMISGFIHSGLRALGDSA